MSNALKHVTIIGGGTAGWMAAAMIFGVRNRRNDGEDLRITLIESPTIPSVGVGEATTLSMSGLLHLLAIDEKDFFQKCDASFKLGVRFDGWDREPDGTPASFLHPFESPPFLYGYAPAHHYHRRRRAGAELPPFAEAMVPLTALLTADRAPRTADMPDFEGLSPYTYHVDAGLLAGYLREFCTTVGVEHVLDDVLDVYLDDRGFVTSLKLERGGDFPVEFVVDCSGFQGIVIRKALDEPFVSYGDSLPCDRACALQVPHLQGAPLPPYTTATALDSGWAWSVPLYSRRGTGYVYSGAHVSDDEALAQLRAHVGPEADAAEPAFIRMNVGRSARSWVNNCVAVGLAGGFIEPLESTSIHFVQMSIRWLLDHFPDRDCSPPLRDGYNKLVEGLYEEIRDFIAMHYHLSNREDTEFWRAARHDLVVPDWLRDRLALWRHKLPSVTDCPSRLSLFSEWSFIYVLYGKGFFDDVTFPIEDALADEDFDEFTAQLDRRRAELLARAPDHRALLEQFRRMPTEPWYRPDGERVFEPAKAALV
jgi:tryptophan halogenase